MTRKDYTTIASAMATVMFQTENRIEFMVAQRATRQIARELEQQNANFDALKFWQFIDAKLDTLGWVCPKF